jgi:hypothetical protein
LSNISVKLSRELRHWQFEIEVDSEIQSRRIFGCSEGVTPLVRSLLAAESQETIPGTSANRDAGYRPSRITVTMPSGRLLTFELRQADESVSEIPQTFGA